MIQSTGIKINEIYIPPFRVDKGDIVIIKLPGGACFTELLFRLVNILTKREQNPYFEVNANFMYARHIVETGWTRVLRPMTVERHIRKEGNPFSSITGKFYELVDLKPKTRINRLPGTQRRLLSVLTTLSWSNNIIFDLVGVDPVGGQTVYDLIKEHVRNEGTAIFIDNFEDFKDDCTKYIRYEMASG